MNLKQLEKSLADLPAYRLTQAKKAIFNDLVLSWEQVTVFPKELRDQLQKACPLEIDSILTKSIDANTVKALLKFEDGLSVEAVLMRHKDRNTVCVSSQVGCPLNCSFCATGKMGFKRNLEMSEIIEQVLFFSRILHADNQKVTNIVFMGMGEPFLNYDNVVGAIRYLNDKDTLNLGMRHFSVSTSGIPDKIKKFANEGFEVNLAVSLHATEDKQRSQLMPVNKTHSLNKVLNALDDYQEQTRRKIMFEYIMIDKVNDNFADAKKLIEIARRYICVINLIPYNPSKNAVYKPSNGGRINKFKSILVDAGVNVVQRFSFGSEIDAACGQLAKSRQD